MNDLLRNIFDLDATGRHSDTLRFLAESREAPTFPYEVYQLLLEGRFVEAYVLARLLRGGELGNPMPLLALAIGGFLFGDQAAEERGAANLSVVIDGLNPEQKNMIALSVVHVVVGKLITGDASITAGRDYSRALRVLDIYKAGFSEFRSIFDWSSTVSDEGYEAVRQQGRERGRPIQFLSPPEGAPRVRRRAIAAVRQRVFPQWQNSRLFDLGLRMEHAMNAYGWDASFLPMSFDYRIDFPAIIAACERDRPDVLLLDDYLIQSAGINILRAAMIERLRKTVPGLKFVSLQLDPWAIDPPVLIETAAPLDGVWAPFPASPVWDHPVFSDKILLMPWPHAGNVGEPVSPLSPVMTFSGGSFAYNWHRSFWLAGIERGMPYRPQLTQHSDDGLPVLESYAAYIRRLEEAGCTLNFSMRPDLSRVATARCFEAMISGALLVQEETADMDQYFIAGEHYLSFTTAPELRAISRMIAERPEQVEEIRRNGNAYARANYNDDKIIGYLDRHLFHRV